MSLEPENPHNKRKKLYVLPSENWYQYDGNKNSNYNGQSYLWSHPRSQSFFLRDKREALGTRRLWGNSVWSNSNFLSHLIFLKQNITWPKVSPCCSANINLSVALGYGLLMCSLNHACNALQVSLGIPLFLRIPEGQMLRGGINLKQKKTKKSKTAR